MENSVKNPERTEEKRAPVTGPPVIGVISEYDPFHNGHAAHLAKARGALGSEKTPVVVVLSSCFTQRGMPAFAGKMARTRMALANGANLVLELPFVHACSPAQEFARGAVEILAASRLVTHLAFGVEDASAFDASNAAPLMTDLLRILIQEPVSFKLNLRENLAAGCSYPKAFALAAERELPGAGRFVSLPNNVLAVSYMAQIQKGGHGIEPVPVQREGGAHNDGAPGRLASASAIRRALSGGWERGDAAWVSGAVPASVMSMLKEERDSGKLCTDTGRLWDLLRGLLVRSGAGGGNGLNKYAGMEEGMGNLFLKRYAKAVSYEDFIGRCVCARYTRTRLQRQVIRCLAGLDRWTEKALIRARAAPPYIRVLGYDGLGRELLRERKRLSGTSVPMITKLSSAHGALARLAADTEFRASRLRELLLPNPDLTAEEKIVPCDFGSVIGRPVI